jgi:hypothetical protein
MALSTIGVFKKYNTSRARLFKLITSRCDLYELTFVSDKQNQILRNYFVLSYSGIQLQGRIRSNSRDEPVIIVDGVAYQVVYKDCTPVSAKRAKKVWVSYRNVVTDIGLPAIALIYIDRDELIESSHETNCTKFYSTESNL